MADEILSRKGNDRNPLSLDFDKLVEVFEHSGGQQVIQNLLVELEIPEEQLPSVSVRMIVRQEELRGISEEHLRVECHMTRHGARMPSTAVRHLPMVQSHKIQHRPFIIETESTGRDDANPWRCRGEEKIHPMGQQAFLSRLG